MYTVCPFQNVTQRKTSGGGLTTLGFFSSWLHEEGQTKDDPLVYASVRAQALRCL